MSPTSASRRGSPFHLPMVVTGLILTISLCRYFTVAESAAAGDTLGVVVAWLVAVACWSFVSCGRGRARLRFCWCDLGVVLLSTAHIVSALVIIGTNGEKRSAINLAWEWCGILACWFLIRIECQRRWFPREVLLAVLATGAMIAALGLYQHYVDFPETSTKYGPMFDRLRVLSPDSPEASRIKNAFLADRIPFEGPARILFEKRLRDSREPLGLFALANNLGGFLAVCFVLTFSLGLSDWRNDPVTRWTRIGTWGILLLLIGWCLLLTKSRTAWIGTAVGVASVIAIAQSHRITIGRLIGAGVFGLLLIGAVWGLTQFGGLDRQVITEAPKSLRYRLQYWSATWKMIKAHPWLGVGPGQFRTQYLLYKLPEASEEISDPHNLFLDVAANAGLLATGGLLVLCAGLLISVSRGRKQILSQPIENGDSITTMIFSTGGFAAVAWLSALISSYDDRLLILIPAVFALYLGLRWILRSGAIRESSFRTASLSAAICLLVHLMGAGGIGMPTILLLLLTLLAVGEPPDDQFPIRDSSKGLLRSCAVVGVATAIIAMILLIETAIRPISSAQLKIMEGDRRISRSEFSEADILYKQAVAADRFDSEPWRRRAELAFLRFCSGGFQSNSLFESAVSLLHEAQTRHPGNFHDDMRLGQWWYECWKVRQDVSDAIESAHAYQRAWERYPTNAILMAEYSMALDAAGDGGSAAVMAGKSLEQDRLNQKLQHVDRYLTDPIRVKLEEIRGRQNPP